MCQTDFSTVVKRTGLGAKVYCDIRKSVFMVNDVKNRGTIADVASHKYYSDVHRNWVSSIKRLVRRLGVYDLHFSTNDRNNSADMYNSKFDSGLTGQMHLAYIRPAFTFMTKPLRFLRSRLLAFFKPRIIVKPN